MVALSKIQMYEKIKFLHISKRHRHKSCNIVNRCVNLVVIFTVVILFNVPNVMVILAWEIMVDNLMLEALQVCLMGI